MYFFVEYFTVFYEVWQTNNSVPQHESYFSFRSSFRTWFNWRPLWMPVNFLGCHFPNITAHAFVRTFPQTPNIHTTNRITVTKHLSIWSCVSIRVRKLYPFASMPFILTDFNNHHNTEMHRTYSHLLSTISKIPLVLYLQPT